MELGTSIDRCLASVLPMWFSPAIKMIFRVHLPRATCSLRTINPFLYESYIMPLSFLLAAVSILNSSTFEKKRLNSVWSGISVFSVLKIYAFISNPCFSKINCFKSRSVLQPALSTSKPCIKVLFSY